jgi:hypothetical protein
MDPINPTAGNPEALNQEPSPKATTDNHWITIVSMAIFVLLSLAAVAFLYYQNQQLKSMLASYQTPTPAPLPSTTPDATANWKVYTNKVFSVKLPEQFEFDTRFSTNPSNMHFTWSQPQNATPTESIDITLGYTQGDPGLTVCKTNEECYQGYAKSFAVSGYDEISTTIDGDRVKGFEVSNDASGVLNYVNFYPVSFGEKLFTFDVQMSAPSIDQAKQFVPQINQILSTFKFINPVASPSSKPVACTLEAKMCPDGSSVGRAGPNCEFAPCPTP